MCLQCHPLSDNSNITHHIGNSIAVKEINNERMFIIIIIIVSSLCMCRRNGAKTWTRTTWPLGPSITCNRPRPPQNSQHTTTSERLHRPHCHLPRPCWTPMSTSARPSSLPPPRNILRRTAGPRRRPERHRRPIHVSRDPRRCRLRTKHE